ncbi:hypothetical protein N781_01935 [Pontibacillus halophilus JSM 076056 = DSM 19796]|uniref:RNA polymerase sigma-70 region 2 domain-containing protein n=2 Tax=Pontibacillus TaxID=289201 RepID=A0A0A5GQ67_9BACI|nr:hypothetical protein N781_01935 [Pontibacillus halophilus JSM 076056 = DSM 19796]
MIDEMKFDDVVDQHKGMIYHILHRLHIKDTEGDYYQEALIALWQAWNTHDAAKSKLSTHIYYTVHKHLLTLIRTQNRKSSHQKAYIEETKQTLNENEESTLFDPYLQQEIESILTEKQYAWFKGVIMNGQPLQAIAAKENTTLEAVKNWGKAAKKKLRSNREVKGYFSQ